MQSCLFDHLLRLVSRLTIVILAGATVSCVAVGPADKMQCPQPRFTGQAPASVYNSSSPLAYSDEVVDAGRKLYEEDAEPACRMCHGSKGDGMGPLASQFTIPPRNFSCAKTVNGIPDGQLFWIIQHGSPGTHMRSYAQLSDGEIWQLVTYIRHLAQKGGS
jgi:mono/diheme cytochrome c family protein